MQLGGERYKLLRIGEALDVCYIGLNFLSS